MEYIFSVVIFAISASITPGPNTIMAMVSGLNFGTVKSLPLLFGISVGFSIMLFVVGMGFGEVFMLYPKITIYMKIAGIIYLLYLAYLIANSGDIKQGENHSKPLGFRKGLLFQWVNGKAWVVCISAVSAFTTPGELYLSQTLTLTSAFLLVGPPCVAFWVCSGAFLKQYLNDSKYVKRFNVGMALLLVASVIPVMKELWY